VKLQGRLSIQLAERYLESYNQRGRGILLGGITGVCACRSSNLRCRRSGNTAARAALGRGAQVIVIDKDLHRLRKIDSSFRQKITTVVANPYTISKGVKFADVY